MKHANKKVGGGKIPIVDKTKCIGCGTCNVVCPEVFGSDEDYRAFVKIFSNYPENKVDTAIQSCPVKAIRWKKGK
jgi:ferredoxin